MDLGRFVSGLGADSTESHYQKRLDLSADGRINTVDVGAYVQWLGKSCTS